jgi:hypothetical protein
MTFSSSLPALRPLALVCGTACTRPAESGERNARCGRARCDQTRQPSRRVVVRPRARCAQVVRSARRHLAVGCHADRRKRFEGRYPTRCRLAVRGRRRTQRDHAWSGGRSRHRLSFALAATSPVHRHLRGMTNPQQALSPPRVPLASIPPHNSYVFAAFWLSIRNLRCHQAASGEVYRQGLTNRKKS